MISVLVFTRNSEADIQGCLASLRWCDDVHVFDACSTDNTVENARQLGAAVTERAYDGYAAHRNAALHKIPFKHPWVLLLEADERVPEPLRDEMLRFTAEAPNECAAARLFRQDIFQGVCLEHTTASPREVRLVRPFRVRYDREAADTLKIGGGTADLASPLHHNPFARGIAYWLDRYNRYSSLEACEMVAERQKMKPFPPRVPAPATLREGVHKIWRRLCPLPLLPLMTWLYLVIFRGAFRDGAAGMRYALLRAVYECVLLLKVREQEDALRRGLTTTATANSAAEPVVATG